MDRIILTGAPGSGKTAILTELCGRGHQVVTEAATDVIAAQQALGDPEPWLDPLFTEKIAELQRIRALAPVVPTARTQFYDRSPICTLALARYLGHPCGPVLSSELDRIDTASFYCRFVYLVRPLGQIEPTAARRISYAQALDFERVHEQTYRELGYHLIEVPPAPISTRAELVAAAADDAKPAAAAATAMSAAADAVAKPAAVDGAAVARPSKHPHKRP